MDDGVLMFLICVCNSKSVDGMQGDQGGPLSQGGAVIGLADSLLQDCRIFLRVYMVCRVTRAAR
jgi:hypothetical protein